MAKSKTAVRKATPIRLPHDGPIHNACNAKKYADSTDLVHRAARLLSIDPSGTRPILDETHGDERILEFIHVEWC
jgi:hypothetical protein